MTNCINCAAPLKGNRCEYCGTVYEDGEAVAMFQKEGSREVVFRIGGKDYSCYLSRVDVRTVGGEAVRDMSGRMIRGDRETKHRFTLDEK